MNRVLFVSQKQAECMRPPAKCALISVTDTTRPEAELSQNWHAVLRVAFDDSDPITFPGLNPELLPLSATQAEAIAAFYLANAAQAKRMIVHCRAGVSRSAAIARALCIAAGLPFPESHVDYNRHVFSVMQHALGGMRSEA